MKYSQWIKEIDKLSKDELTTFLSAYRRNIEWKNFSDAFLPQWIKEIDKLSKDELTTFLSAYRRIIEWEKFSDAFLLYHFMPMVSYVEERIETSEEK